MDAFEKFISELRNWYNLDAVFPAAVGKANAEAEAELARLQKIEVAVQVVFRTENVIPSQSSDKSIAIRLTRHEFKQLAAALSQKAAG